MTLNQWVREEEERTEREDDSGSVGRHSEIVSGWQAPPQSHCAYSSLSVSPLVFLTRRGVKREIRKKVVLLSHVFLRTLHFKSLF